MNRATEVFPGVLRIQLPLPFELASVNVHLLRLDSGYLLLDCGMDTVPSLQALEEGLASARIAWQDIRTILLTHTHPDHVGLARKLLDRTGARLMMHREECRQLEVVTTPGRRDLWINRAFTESAVPAPLQQLMQEHFGVMRRNFHPLTPDHFLVEGEFIETAIGEFEILWTPGHSPGHVCLYSSRHRLLIAGDQILPDITPTVPWLPERDSLSDFLGSLQDLKQFDVNLIVPSHGKPFTGHRDWIDETSRHHYRRCDGIRNLLVEPKTAHALVGNLWNRKLSPINQQFALLEVMSHLEFMLRQGQIRSEQNDGVVTWFA